MHTELKIHDGENQRLVDGLRQALNANYAQLLKTARHDWERHFAGNDPSDACVSVRVTSGDSPKSSLPCGGVLRRPGRSLVSGYRPGLTA
jgi:hypothetical protein